MPLSSCILPAGLAWPQFECAAVTCVGKVLRRETAQCARPALDHFTVRSARASPPSQCCSISFELITVAGVLSSYHHAHAIYTGGSPFGITTLLSSRPAADILLPHKDTLCGFSDFQGFYWVIPKPQYCLQAPQPFVRLIFTEPKEAEGYPVMMSSLTAIAQFRGAFFHPEKGYTTQAIQAVSGKSSTWWLPTPEERLWLLELYAKAIAAQNARAARQTPPGTPLPMPDLSGADATAITRHRRDNSSMPGAMFAFAIRFSLEAEAFAMIERGDSMSTEAGTALTVCELCF